MKEIQLTKGKVTIIDDGDFEMLSAFKWHAVKWRHVYYAQAWINGGEMSMHRFLLAAKREEIADHINGDGLDNRRENLRLVPPAVNRLNSRLSRNNTSGFKGVYLQKKTGKWTAMIGTRTNGKLVSTHLGTFATPEEASAAYQAAVRERYGEI